MSEDILTLESDPQDGVPLIRLVMTSGRRLGSPQSLSEARSLAASQIRALPEQLQRLDGGSAYPVRVPPALVELAREVDLRTAP